MIPNPGSKYRPSNGTEGDCFMSAWCANCHRFSGEYEGFDEKECEIVLRAYAFDIDDDEYPDEWIYGENGEPICKAFEDICKEPKPYRCKDTPDMFGEAE